MLAFGTLDICGGRDLLLFDAFAVPAARAGDVEQAHSCSLWATMEMNLGKVFAPVFTRESEHLIFL